MVPQSDRAGASRGGVEEARERYRDAARRDPRRFPCGYLAGDLETGAVAPFLWFATPAELIAFLKTTEVDLLELEPADAAPIVGWLERTTAGTRDVSRLDRQALSSCFAGWVEIVWIGTFADLCERGGEFQTRVRADFRTEHDLGLHCGPIADDERDAFAVWLASGAASL